VIDSSLSALAAGQAHLIGSTAGTLRLLTDWELWVDSVDANHGNYFLIVFWTEKVVLKIHVH